MRGAILHAFAIVAFVPCAANAQRYASVIAHDSSVAKQEPGPHHGTGVTTGYSFFANEPELDLVFRKRVLHPGASIGLHVQEEDEIYYVVSGAGEMTLNGKTHSIAPGTAILTRIGSSHATRQVGHDDLVLIITYLKRRAR